MLQAISGDEVSCFTDLPVLAGDDVEDLKQILRGEEDPGILVDRKRAVNALARSESSSEAAEILEQILSNPGETIRVRSVAANDLSLMPSEAAEAALLRNADAESEVVRAEVFKSLGRVGTAKALEHLAALPEPKTEHARQQLSLARVAISFRSGAEGRGAQDANRALGVRWTTHAVRPVEGERLRKHVAALRGSTYGIGLNPETGFEISCGERATHLLFLNEAVRRGAFIESVRSGKMIAGLVGLLETAEQRVTIRYLVLTTPTERGLEVVVTRTNGDVAYVGEALPDGDGLRLTMRDVGLERTATEIEGRASNEDLQLSLRVWRGQAKPKRHGEPILV
ncbi:MAG TPA: HEAT repeat domain-containing protein [Pyrinomonadaceae bacterium]|nr:HEAT repeat domain-containing protein [Pyrinomonadaceae bacterium]